jgi:hypothetical protein
MMRIEYSLQTEDHLAWFDYHQEMVFPISADEPQMQRLEHMRRSDRAIFAQSIEASPNRTAHGTRALELTEIGVRESSSDFDFVTLWKDVALVVHTSTHLFIVHASMNAHIVPLCSFTSIADRDAFVAFALSKGSNQPNKAVEPTATNPPPSATPPAPLAHF